MSNMNDFVIEDGVLKKYVGQGGDVVIPEGVFTIASEAFRDKKSVETVAFPSSVISIEEHAFSNMEKLREIVLPKHLQRLEKETF